MEFREFFEKQQKQDESLKGIATNALNVLVGAARTGAGAMTIGDEALAKLVGQGTKGRMTSGVNQFKRGLKQVFIGDPKDTQLKAPQPVEPQPQLPPQNSKPQEKKPEPRPIAKTKKVKTKEEKWNELAKKLKEAKTLREREEIQKQMGLLDPIKYGQIFRTLKKYRRFNNRRII